MKTDAIEKLKRLRINEDEAAQALRAELERHFPKGTRVTFQLRSDQKNKSTGSVIGYRGHGYLAVLHDQAKEGSRFKCRNVYFERAQKTELSF